MLRMTAMLRMVMVLVLGLTALALYVPPPAAAENVVVTRQKSSHDAAFFESLLSGRVWVYQRLASDRASVTSYVRAEYFHKDGRLTGCSATPTGGVDHSGRWRMVPSSAFVTLYNYIPQGEEPDPRQVRNHLPMFYEPETGQLHNESWVSGETWEVLVSGWVQESWPAALLRACPDVRPPAVVPLNRKQESVVFRVLLREDTTAPVRAFPGSERGVPGARGLAASGHQPTFPAEALRAWLMANNGTVVRSGIKTYALVLSSRSDELWLLEEDTDEVVDTIVLTPSEDGDGMVMKFTQAPVRVFYRLGYPLGLLATGERYGAMAMMDSLVESGEPVALPFMDRESVGFRFLADGGLRVGTLSGAEIGGEWWWSKGMLHLQVEGIDAVNTFEWRALASHVGWSE